MSKTLLAVSLLLLPAVAPCQQISRTDVGPEAARTWTVTLQGGFTDTFQMVLGGTFGAGPDWQDRMVLSLNNLFREGDSLSMFGWNTTDFPTAKTNWQAGMLYKNRVLKMKHHTLVLGVGVQRWLLPSVKSGAQDWLVSGSLNYATTVKRLPVSISQDSWSLLRSTLPTGSVVYTQINTQHTLLTREGFKLALRHGPHYTYSWGFYGAQGNRVVRYAGTLVANWKGTTIEGGCRQQFGLQDGIRNNRYWSILVSRQFTRPLAFWQK